MINFALSYRIIIFLSLWFFLSSFTLVFAFDFCNLTPFSFLILTVGEVVKLFIAVFSASFNSIIFPVIIVPFEPLLVF